MTLVFRTEQADAEHVKSGPYAGAVRVSGCLFGSEAEIAELLTHRTARLRLMFVVTQHPDGGNTDDK